MDTKIIERVRIARLKIEDCNETDAWAKYVQLKGVFDVFLQDFTDEAHDAHQLLINHMALEKKCKALEEELEDLNRGRNEGL